jgi:hypothetical protein
VGGDSTGVIVRSIDSDVTSYPKIALHIRVAEAESREKGRARRSFESDVALPGPHVA